MSTTTPTSPADTVQPGDSASQIDSTTSSTGRQLAARRAALEAEAPFLRRQQELEVKQLQLQQQQLALEKQINISSLRAKERALSEVEGGSDNEVLLNPRAAEWFPQRNSPQTVDVPLTEQGLQHKQLLDMFQLPSLQIPQFDENQLQYHNFIHLFEATVECNTVDSSARLARLLQYCTGKARHVISG